jgi:butyrate kinase
MSLESEENTRRENIRHNIEEFLRFMQRQDVVEERRRFVRAQMEELGLLPTVQEYVDEAEQIIKGEKKDRG